MQIFVLSITGRTITLDIKDENESIDDLYIKYKTKINVFDRDYFYQSGRLRRRGFDPYDLFFNGVRLLTNNGYNLKYYNIICFYTKCLVLHHI